MDFIRKRILIFLIILGLVSLTVLSTFLIYRHSHSNQLVVGAKDPEGHLLAEIIAQLYEGKTQKKVVRKHSFDGTFITFNALLSGEISLYVEYTGTAYTSILKRNPKHKNTREIFSELKKIFLQEYDLVWMDPLGFKSTYVLITTEELAQTYQLNKLSDLKRVIDQGASLKVAFDPEFCSRSEMDILRKDYQIQLGPIQRIEHALLYVTLVNKGIDIMNGYAADSSIIFYELCVLEDDLDYFPSYEAVPIVRAEVLQEYPELRDILTSLAGRVTLDEMRKMNYEVEKKERSVYDVARAFLIQEGFFSN